MNYTQVIEQLYKQYLAGKINHQDYEHKVEVIYKIEETMQSLFRK